MNKKWQVKELAKLELMIIDVRRWAYYFFISLIRNDMYSSDTFEIFDLS